MGHAGDADDMGEAPRVPRRRRADDTGRYLLPPVEREPLAGRESILRAVRAMIAQAERERVDR